MKSFKQIVIAVAFSFSLVSCMETTDDSSGVSSPVALSDLEGRYWFVHRCDSGSQPDVAAVTDCQRSIFTIDDIGGGSGTRYNVFGDTTFVVQFGAPVGNRIPYSLVSVYERLGTRTDETGTAYLNPEGITFQPDGSQCCALSRLYRLSDVGQSIAQEQDDEFARRSDENARRNDNIATAAEIAQGLANSNNTELAGGSPSVPSSTPPISAVRCVQLNSRTNSLGTFYNIRNACNATIIVRFCSPGDPARRLECPEPDQLRVLHHNGQLGSRASFQLIRGGATIETVNETKHGINYYAVQCGGNPC